MGVVVHNGLAIGNRSHADMGSAGVEDWVGVEALVHSKDAKAICCRPETGAVARTPVRFAQALRLHLVKVARVGVVAAGV